jgi:hypothetical protein
MHFDELSANGLGGGLGEVESFGIPTHSVQAELVEACWCEGGISTGSMRTECGGAWSRGRCLFASCVSKWAFAASNLRVCLYLPTPFRLSLSKPVGVEVTHSGTLNANGVLGSLESQALPRPK